MKFQRFVASFSVIKLCKCKKTKIVIFRALFLRHIADRQFIAHFRDMSKTTIRRGIEVFVQYLADITFLRNVTIVISR